MVVAGRQRIALGLLLAGFLSRGTHSFVPTYPNDLRRRQSSLRRLQTRPDNTDVSDLPKISVLIPAYNEEDRITETLQDCASFLRDQPYGDGTNVIVVNDGSKDHTTSVVENVANELSTKIKITVLSLPRNQGKGAAVAFGIASVYESNPRSLILTTDADGSANIAGLNPALSRIRELLEKNAEAGSSASPWDTPAMVAGYRSYESASTPRLVFRWGFRTVVKTICGDLGVKDSQCGFKLMTAAAGIALYRDLNLQGWSHDVEVLYRAQQLGIPVAESDVDWLDKDGSKLIASPGGAIAVCAKMFTEIVQLRLSYAVGLWTLSGR